MRFILEGLEYDVSFAYAKNEPEWIRSCRINRKPAFVKTGFGENEASTLHHANETTCIIRSGAPGSKYEDLELFAEGVAWCSCLDAPNRKKGRKLAVAHALRNIAGVFTTRIFSDFKHVLWGCLFAHRIVEKS